jgi:hypothetical protein
MLTKAECGRGRIKCRYRNGSVRPRVIDTIVRERDLLRPEVERLRAELRQVGEVSDGYRVEFLDMAQALRRLLAASRATMPHERKEKVAELIEAEKHAEAVLSGGSPGTGDETTRALIQRLYEERNRNCEIAVGLAERIHHEREDYGAYVRAMDELVGDDDAEVDAFLAAQSRTDAADLRSVLAYYADESNYNDDGAPVYENLGPPEGWVGEEFDPQIKLDEGMAARDVLRES